MNTDSLVHVRDVKQAFRGGFWLKKIPILHGITFDIPKGSIFGLLGPNGAGKTTLIHILTGLKKPVSGQVEILGHRPQDLNARKLVGYLPERPYFYEHLTGLGFLKYLGALSGVKGSDLLNQANRALSRVGMSHAANLELGKYSKGMLQRIGIAQAILHDPELLILDEPMSGLDPVGRKEIRELILELHQAGKTILFSTHILADAESICDEVAIIKKGNLAQVGPLTDFLSKGKDQVEIMIKRPHPDLRALQVKSTEISMERTFTKLILKESGELPTLIKKMVDLGVEIVSINPLRQSLEDYFVSGDSGKVS